jgi:transcriptional regulator with GAF, ATPase, and Fis domain
LLLPGFVKGDDMDDESDFFQQFSLRICGSLDIREALPACLSYVRHTMPVDELILTVYDRTTGSLEVIARADSGGVSTGPHTILMPAHLREELEHVEKYPRVRVRKDMRRDLIIKEVAAHFKWRDSSVIVARLIIENSFIGSLIIRAEGKGRYGEEHARLWSVVNEPVAIALINSLRYRELLQLKDALLDDNRYLHDELRNTVGTQIVGANFGLKGVMEQVSRVAPLGSPVLLIGETGTGKEVIANAIHTLSPRNEGPLITVNCGAIPESLVDSELFGHEKGAFTGAVTQRRGRFERAHKGTIFLDEVGELPLHAQVRLLRVLQEKEVERVGSSEPTRVDIRVISATHKSLETMISQHLFREDLYYRLAVYPIHIPPLRKRRADIPALIDYFVTKRAREIGLRSMPVVSERDIDRLMAYDWPGNVRELANIIEQALIQSTGPVLTFDDLTSLRQKSELPDAEEDLMERRLRLQEVEYRHVRHVMEMTDGRVEGKNGAAVLLGMNPATLRHRLQKLGIPFGRHWKNEEEKP